MGRRAIRFAAASILATVLVWSAGCSQSSSPVASNNSGAKVNILSRPMLGKAASTTGTDSAYITPEGGDIVFTDVDLGNSTVHFPAGAVSESKWYYITVTSAGPIYVTLEPHNPQFGQDVTLDLSYKGADLTGVDESTIQLYYYDEANGGTWDPVPTTPVPSEDRLVATLSHFSQYAPGSEE